MLYLYRDFIWENIYDIFKKQNIFNVFSGKVNVNEPETINERLLHEMLTKKYTDGTNLRMLKDVFDSIMFYKSKKKSEIPHLDSLLSKFMNEFHLASEKETSEGFVLLSNFKDMKDMIVIKTARSPSSNYNILFEYFIGTVGINRLREFVPNFTYTLGIFKCSPIEFNEQSKSKSKKDVKLSFMKTNDEENKKQFYVMFEKIPGKSLDAFIRSMRSKEDVHKLISYFVQICLALQIAQNEIDFVHYDLHTENIIMRPLPEPTVIEYKINDTIYKIETDMIPTIIDYGFSHFIHKGISYGDTVFHSLGISPTTTATGYDCYKLFMYIFNHLYIEEWALQDRIRAGQTRTYERQKGLFDEFVGLIEFFADKKEPHNVYDSYKKEGISPNMYENLKKGLDKYFSVTSKNPEVFYAQPIHFVNWIQKNKPIVFGKYIKIIHEFESLNLMDKISNSKKYETKLTMYKILGITEKDSLENCDIFKTINKSFIINKYIVSELTQILERYGKENIENVEKIKNKIKLIEKYTNENQKELYQNDFELYSKSHIELEKLSKQIDIPLYTNKIKYMKYTSELKPIYQLIQPVIHFVEFFEEYRNFVEYATRSRPFRVHKKMYELYYECKNFMNYFRKIQSNKICTSLLSTLDSINRIIQDNQTKEEISYVDWKIDDNFLNAFHNYYKISQDVVFYFPDSTETIKKIDEFIYRLVDVLSKYKNISLYLPTKSKKQIRHYLQASNHISRNNTKYDYMKPLMNIAMRIMENKYERNVFNVLKSGKVDNEIYNDLRPFVRPQKDKERRARNRVNDLKFLLYDKNFIDFRNILSNDFNYLDIGGNDGSITSALGNFINLDKNNIICADVDEWFESEKERPYENVTYVSINPNGPLPFRNDYFSLVTSFQVLHHIENLEERMKEISRIVMKGGYFVIREHDCTNSMTRILLDIEHSFHELCTKEDVNEKYLDEYDAYYLTFNEIKSIIERHKFKYIATFDYRNNNDFERNPTRIYYAAFVKL